MNLNMTNFEPKSIWKPEKKKKDCKLKPLKGMSESQYIIK